VSSSPPCAVRRATRPITHTHTHTHTHKARFVTSWSIGVYRIFFYFESFVLKSIVGLTRSSIGVYRYFESFVLKSIVLPHALQIEIRPDLILVRHGMETPAPPPVSLRLPSGSLRCGKQLAPVRRTPRHTPCKYKSRQIYQRGFTDFTREEVSALGSLPLSTFYLRVRSLPGVNPKPPSSPILDSTVCY